MSELQRGATGQSIYDRPTPRTDELLHLLLGIAAVKEVPSLVALCRKLEQELETCRDAHMANCLAADTLRTEIRALRSEIGRQEVGRVYVTQTHVRDTTGPYSALPVGVYALVKVPEAK